jgi:hypothetical protein
VNGTLFAYPLQVQTRFTSPSIDPNATNSIGPNQPYACYCNQLAYFDYQTNNFYYRVAPYNEVAGYVGRDNKKGIVFSDLKGNKRILGNPTTIMDLGPRNDYMDELSYSDEFLGYVVNRLDSTSFQDVDELLNLFIIQRLVSASIRDIIKSSGRAGANTDPVKRYFSRENLKVDGDYAQMCESKHGGWASMDEVTTLLLDNQSLKEDSEIVDYLEAHREGGWIDHLHGLATVGRDLDWPALETLGPKLEALDALETEVLGVPSRGLLAIGHANMNVIEPTHAKPCTRHRAILA